MAIKYLNNISLELNELQNFKVDPKASEPTGVLAQMYFNTGTDKLRIYTSTGWEDVDSGSMSSWTLAGSSGTPQAITNGETATIAGSTFISSVAGATDTVTLSLSATGTPSSSTFLRGDNTWATPAYYSGWSLAGDGGTPQSITSGNTATFSGGTYITTSAGATDTLTITHNNTSRTDTTSSASPAFGGTFTAVDSVTSNATGHITAINLKTVTLPTETGTMASFNLAGDTGTTQTITNGNTLTVAGSVGIDTVAGATDTVTINLDLAELNTTTTWTKASDYLAVVDGGANAKILSTNISLSDWAVPTADLSMGTHKITNVVDPTLAQDAATKNYVDLSVAGSGALIYQGGYNAATNTPDLDSSPSSSIKKGWTYTVTADGTFFTEQVRVGDLLIAEVDAPTTLADWTTVQNNIDLATYTIAGIASFSSSDFTVSSGAVSILNVNLGTQTTGNYVATVSEGAGIDITGGTGEGTSNTITLDLNELTAATTAAHLAGNDGSGNTRKFTIANIATQVASANSWAGTIGGSTSITVTSATHGLGTDSSAFMIQLVEVSTGETVFTDTTRGASGAVTFDFATAPAANAIRVLIQKIG